MTCACNTAMVTTCPVGLAESCNESTCAFGCEPGMRNNEQPVKVSANKVSPKQVGRRKKPTKFSLIFGNWRRGFFICIRSVKKD